MNHRGQGFTTNTPVASKCSTFRVMTCSPYWRAVAAIRPSLPGIVLPLFCALAVRSPQVRDTSTSIPSILVPWSRSNACSQASRSRRRLLSFRSAIPLEISPTVITLRKMSLLSRAPIALLTEGWQSGRRSSETTHVSNRTLTVLHPASEKYHARYQRPRDWGPFEAEIV